MSNHENMFLRPVCGDDCTNCEPPYCHCIVCGETDVELDEHGQCVVKRTCNDCGGLFPCDLIRRARLGDGYYCGCIGALEERDGRYW